MLVSRRLRLQGHQFFSCFVQFHFLFSFRMPGKGGIGGRRVFQHAKKAPITAAQVFLQLLLPQHAQHLVHLLFRLFAGHTVVEKTEHHVLEYGGHEHLIV